MTDNIIVDRLKKLDLPVTRENYVGLNWLGDYDPKKMLPAELEAGLPKELQMQEGSGQEEDNE